MSRATLLGPDSNDLWVLIEGDQIIDRGTGDPPQVGPDALVMPCPQATIESGAVNAHTHMYSGLAPFGMPAPDEPPETFVQILERVWWRLDRALDEDSLRASTRVYVAEALLHGTTALIDHHESPHFIDGSLAVLAHVCDDFGLRAVLCYGATERNGGIEEGRAGLAECRRFLASSHNPLRRGMVALHASFTVSDELLREAAALCRELDAAMHVHLAEAASDVADAIARGYDGPAERLLALSALPPGSICAHGVHLGDSVVRRLDDAGCWLVQNPRSNENNGVGYPSHHTSSSKVALGTDGFPADMGDEAEALQRLGALHGDAEQSLAQRRDNSRILLSECFSETFALEKGAAADLVVRDIGAARHVFVAGKQVVADGQLAGHDIDKIRAEAQIEAARLWERMRAI